jgi:hypothetical protein
MLHGAERCAVEHEASLWGLHVGVPCPLASWGPAGRVGSVQPPVAVALMACRACAAGAASGAAAYIAAHSSTSQLNLNVRTASSVPPM